MAGVCGADGEVLGLMESARTEKLSLGGRQVLELVAVPPGRFVMGSPDETLLEKHNKGLSP